jgi:hypothetical protein
MRNEADQALEDAFDDGDGSEDGEDELDDRQRLMRASPSPNDAPTLPSTASASESHGNQSLQSPQRHVRLVPSFASSTNPSGRVVGMGNLNDGVFANLNAKPERGEKTEDDLPPVCLLHVLPSRP